MGDFLNEVSRKSAPLLVILLNLLQMWTFSRIDGEIFVMVFLTVFECFINFIHCCFYKTSKHARAFMHRVEKSRKHHKHA